jgi:hypothetical protein
MEKPLVLVSHPDAGIGIKWLDGSVYYFVGDVEVSAEVYRDVLATISSAIASSASSRVNCLDNIAKRRG